LSEDQRIIFGAATFSLFAQLLPAWDDPDGWVAKMWNLPTTVVSNSLQEPLGRPNATVASGDAVDIVTRLKEESDVPLRSHGSISLNRALMAAGLVDRVQLTIFPAITGQAGANPIFQGGADFDLELIEARTFDDHTQELTYVPTLHA
jgi:dihydrofolate reductase